MRTKIVIDYDLIEEAFRYSTSRTKKDLIHEALVTFIEIRKRMNLMDLKGKIRFSDTYDYKKARERGWFLSIPPSEVRSIVSLHKQL